MKNYFNTSFLAIILIFSCLFTSGCGSRYRYYSTKKNAEKALMENDLETAKKLFAVIYNNESKSEKRESSRINWAYYRLGVVHELLNESKLAKGYYWGDSIEKGFYDETLDIAWWAETGWKIMDEGKTSRSLPEILELEKKRRPTSVVRKADKKRVYKPRKRANVATFDDGHKRTRVFDRSLTPPNPNSPEPFRVYY